MAIGNPAPLGLFGFGVTTSMLMFVECHWAEPSFTDEVYGFALAFGGFVQLIAGVFELIKGSSFAFSVFGGYGGFWLAWAAIYHASKDNGSMIGSEYKDGKTLFFILWGCLTACFWVITFRKNMCLVIIFTLLVPTFFLLAASAQTEEVRVTKAAGYLGFFTAFMAIYTGVAELINEEFGGHVLPGLKPLYTPERHDVATNGILHLMTYDASSNTLFLRFRGLQILTQADINAIQRDVMAKIKELDPPGGKVHTIVDYQGVNIANELLEKYWKMVGELQKEYYLSAKRFGVSSFGTNNGQNTSTIGTTSIQEAPPTGV